MAILMVAGGNIRKLGYVALQIVPIKRLDSKGLGSFRAGPRRSRLTHFSSNGTSERRGVDTEMCGSTLRQAGSVAK